MKSLARNLIQLLGFVFWTALLTGALTSFATDPVESAGPLATPRKNHTATLLSDGRVLVVGGENDSNQLGSAEIFDPANKSFTSAGAMNEPRVGHAATLLTDGKVLITGGRNSSGALSTAELFDPTTSTFSVLAAHMGTARVRHTSTLMADGRVLLAGGDLAGTAEIFDPVTQTFSTSLTAMIEARSGQSATLLPENSVLFAGGGSRSVELFDVQTNEFLSWTSALNEPRTGHSAITGPATSIYFVGGEDFGTLERFDYLGGGSTPSLPLGAPSSSASPLANGKVLILGPVLSDLFNPATNALLPLEGADLLKRSGQTVTELPADKHILVVGGVDANTAYVAPAALYSPARIETDKADYYPDEPVIVYGSGWKPGEDVDLYVVDDQGWLYDSTVSADADGLFTADPYFVVLMQHLGVTFDLTALGAQSGLKATHTFTDSPLINSNVTVSAQSSTITYGTAGTTTVTVTATRQNGPASVTATYTVTGLPTGVTGVYSPATFTANGNGAFPSSTLTLTVPATLEPGSYNFSVRCAQGADAGTGTGTLIVSKKNLTVSGAVANSKIYDGNTTATVDFSSTTLVGIVGNDSVNLRTNGYSASFADKNVGTSKSVTVSGLTLNGGKAGNYNIVQPSGLSADITAKNLTITGAIANSKVFDGTTAATVNFSGASLVGIISPDSVTISTASVTASFADRNVGTNKAVTVTGVSLGGTASGNYTVSQPTGLTANVTALGITGNFTVSSKVYDGNATATILTRSLNGVISPDIVTLSGGTASFANANAGTGKPVTGTGFTLTGANSANYTLSSVNSTTADIQKANATVTVTPYSVTYDGVSHTATGTAKGVINETLSGLDLTGTTHKNAGTYAADAWTFTDVTGNYNNISGTVSDSIAKANPTIVVTPYSVTYDAAAHTATGTAKGVLNEALNGLDLSGTTHTNAGTYSADAWTFTDSTGNYNNTSGSVSDSIAKANATIVVTPYSVTYDAAAHTANGTAKGVSNETLSGLDLSGTTHTNAGTYAADAWTFTDVTGNYNNTSGTVSDSIAKANATIVVTPYSATFNGAAHTATGTATGVLNDALSGLDLSGTTHTNAGSYTNDVWTFTDVTGNYNNTGGTVSDSIAKANASIVVTPYNVTYDAAAHTANGTAKGVLNETLSGLDLSGTTHTNAGTYPADAWTFTDVSGNYNDASGTISDSIAKADATITVSGYTGIYNGAAHGATGTATGVGGVDLSGSLSLGTTFTDAPGGTANWSFAGGTNYNDQNGSVAIVINKADAVVSVTGYTGIYDGAAHGATGSATGIGGASLPGLSLGSTFTNVPGGIASWSFAGGTNYNDQNGSVEIVINKADAVVTVTGYTGVYDGAAHGATGSATGIGGASLPGLSLGSTFTNVPGGTANWSFAGGTNYNDQSGSVAILINKANASVTVDGYSGIYDGNAHGATGAVMGVKGETLAGLDLGASFTNVPGGTANWSFTDATGNYNNATGSAPIVISKANASVIVHGYSGAYDGNAHGATGSAVGVKGESLGGLDLGATFINAPGGTADWSFIDSTGNYNNASGSTAIVISKADAILSVTGYSGIYDGNAHGASGTAHGVKGETLTGLDLGASFTNAPGGTANWSFTDSTGNYNSTSGSAEIVIAKANASIAVTPYSVTYNAAAHTATGTAKGILNETLAGLDLSGTTHTNAGTYSNDIWTFTDTTGNYNDANGTVSDSIAKADATVTVTGYTGVYDGAAHGATGTATGIGGVALSGLDLGVSFKDVSGGTAQWAFTGGQNYKDQSGSVEIVISKRPASLVANAKNKVYGDNNPVLDATLGNVVAGDTLNYTLDTTATQLSGVGSYPITVTLGSNPNYSVTPTNGTLTVTKKDASVTANAKSKTYGDQNPTLDATPTGAVNGDILNYTLGTTAVQFSNVGTYPITVTLGSNPNYNVTSTDSILTVNTKSLTVTANDRTKTFGDVVTFTGTEFTTSGLINGNTVTSVTLTSTGAAATAAVSGSPYDIVPSAAVGTGLSNYSINYVNGKLTVKEWSWTGFFQPVDNMPVVNRVKAGSAVPMKFSLGGNKGLAIIVSGYPLIGAIPTNDGAPVSDIEVTVTAGGSSLSYDAASNQYNYVWKTDKAYAGRSYRFALKLADGSFHYADFNFTK